MTGRVLVVGATGRLGLALSAELNRRGVPFDAPGRESWRDPSHGAIAEHVAGAACAAVVNAAAFTDVAAAERPENRTLVAWLNAELPGRLARLCAARGVPLVHVSTDYVFDGAKRTPYVESDATRPLQEYGRSKLDGERAVTAAGQSTLIARVSTLYGESLHGRDAYVDAILAQARARAAQGGGAVEVVETPVASPTYTADVAPALLDLVERRATGIVHVVNDGEASRLQLARAAVELAGLAGRVDVRTRPEPAGALARPAYSVLDTAKLRGLLGRGLPPWREALSRYIERGGGAS